MTRERLVWAALRCWPAAVRATRGPEMADTLLDASDSRARFARELAVLVWRGLGTRAVAPSGVPRAFADGACLAGALMAAEELGVELRLLHWERTLVPLAIGAAVLALALAGRDRPAGVGLLALVLWLALDRADLAPALAFLSVPFLCAVTMTVAPRRRPRPRHELAVALVPIAGVLGSTSVLLDALIIVSIAAAATFPRDPRPVIACALVWLTGGLALATVGRRDSALAVLLLTAPPAALIVAAIAHARGTALRDAPTRAGLDS